MQLKEIIEADNVQIKSSLDRVVNELEVTHFQENCGFLIKSLRDQFSWR